ncbi:MAG: ABC transporter ATP-binding protein [Nitrospira sp.]|nr:ABC transporter ATP-binding protein [Nitrospira sp.]
MANRLVVKNIHAGYGAVRVLHGISLVLNEGEMVVLLGTNGNGKSTLMHCMMGLVTPDSGEIYWELDGDRIELMGRAPEEIVNLGISLVPEGRRLFPKLTVEENLLVGAFRKGARKYLSQNLAFCYEAFSILAERRNQLAGSLSGGEQQMLAIARALMSQPRILLVDEPSIGLAPIWVSQVILKIKELQEKYRLTVLMAEQNFHQATKIADRGYLLIEGKIEFEGHNTEELSKHELVKKYYLGL